MLALVVRALTEEGVGYDIVSEVGFALALPLVALLAASAVLGPEIDDGSIVYLLAKPVPRHVVVLSKYVVAWLATLGARRPPPAARGAGARLLRPRPRGRLGRGRARVGDGVHGSVPGAGRADPSRRRGRAAVRAPWEGLLGGLLSGIRWLASARGASRSESAVSDALDDPGTGLTYALIAALAVTVGSVWFAGDRLRSFTLRGDE